MMTMSASHSRRSLMGPLLSGSGASPAPLIHTKAEAAHVHKHC
jgi:hypothetical protein